MSWKSHFIVPKDPSNPPLSIPENGSLVIEETMIPGLPQGFLLQITATNQLGKSKFEFQIAPYVFLPRFSLMKDDRPFSCTCSVHAHVFPASVSGIQRSGSTNTKLMQRMYKRSKWNRKIQNGRRLSFPSRRYEFFLRFSQIFRRDISYLFEFCR